MSTKQTADVQFAFAHASDGAPDTTFTVGETVQIVASGITTDAYLNVIVFDDFGEAAYPVGFATDGSVTVQYQCIAAGTVHVEVHALTRNRWTTLPGAGSFTAVAA